MRGTNLASCSRTGCLTGSRDHGTSEPCLCAPSILTGLDDRGLTNNPAGRRGRCNPPLMQSLHRQSKHKIDQPASTDYVKSKKVEWRHSKRGTGGTAFPRQIGLPFLFYCGHDPRIRAYSSSSQTRNNRTKYDKMGHSSSTGLMSTCNYAIQGAVVPWQLIANIKHHPSIMVSNY